MKIIVDNLEFLKKISKVKSIPKRNRLLKEASSEEILSILETSINILKFRVNLNARQRNRLLKYADFIRKLARQRTEKSTRKILQTGEGAVLPALLIPIIAQVVSSLINKAPNNG